jgi:hypothetical protein
LTNTPALTNGISPGTNNITTNTAAKLTPPKGMLVQPLVVGTVGSAVAKVAAAPVDWVGNWSLLSQSLTLSSNVQISAIKANLQAINSTSAHFEIRTASNGGGTNLGSSSTVTSLTTGWNTFNFSTPVNVPAGTTVYLTYVSSGVDFWFLANDTIATGQAFNGTNPADGGNYDWCIEVDAR